MTVDQLHAMAASPLVQIGAHTRTHLQLLGQREQVQRDEVIGSVEDLRGLLGSPVTTFAYPFGSESAVGELAPRLVEEAGCALAVSTRSAAVVRGDDRWTLPRLNVQDWPAEELARRIRALT
jgi:peptidoglycan/xylan/chitin deacetylase (PgdA/CDA1 family)